MKKETQLIQSGREPECHYGAVNPPIYQTSTVLFPTIEAYEDAEAGKSAYYDDLDEAVRTDLSYGITGTPTTFSLAKSIAALEGAEHTLLYPSGLSAITMTLQSLLRSGDHILVPDSVYGPTRRFCRSDLKRFGVEATFYDPLVGGDIADLIQDNTKILFLESPGSLTFEIQDIPAMVEVAKARDVITIIDNSWATPLYLPAIEMGVDISIQAVTKYIGGHSDVLMGSVSTNSRYFKPLYKGFKNSGVSVNPQECYLAHRGLRTMAVRLAYHEKNALALAKWLQDRPEVKRVIHPALPDCPGHALWKRDFSGSTGLFAFVVHPFSEAAVRHMVNQMALFGIGCSWGGYESLILPFDPRSVRTATTWEEEGVAIRVYAGLEDTDDLIGDLEQGFENLKAFKG